MQFENHQAIWFFWALPALLVAFLFWDRKRRTILFRFINKKDLSVRLPDYAPWAAWLQNIIFLLALFFLGIALLKPYAGFEMREVAKKGVDIAFLVDLSPSMLAQDAKPSRLDRVKFKLKDFLGQLTGDRAALIGFSGQAFALVPLTGDYQTLNLFIDELSPELIPVPGTNIDAAMNLALETFQKYSPTSSKAVVLITDGEDSLGWKDETVTKIKEQGVKVFVMGVGTPEGAPIPLAEGGYKTDAEGNVILTKLNEKTLQELALSTGGGYVRTGGGDGDVRQIYKEGIKKSLADAEIAKTQKKLPYYRFQWALLSAFILLCLETLVSKKRGPFSRFIQRMRSSKSIVALFIFILFNFLMIHSAQALNPFTLEEANREYEKGDYAKALEKFSALKESDPQNSDVDYNLGNTYFKMNQYPEAEQSYKNALNSPDENIRKQSLYNLGNTLFRQNKFEEAISYYEKALQFDPDYQKAKLNEEFAKKKLEEQKQQQEQKDQEQKDQEQKDQEQKDQEQKDQEQKDQEQKDQEQKDQEQKDQEQKDQEQKDQEQKDQEQKDQEQKDQEQKDQEQKDQEQKDQEQKDQEQKDQEQKDQEQKDQEQKDQEQKDQEQKDPQNSKQEFEGDRDPHQWLKSLQDDPGQALQYIIRKKSVDKSQTFDKDW